MRIKLTEKEIKEALKSLVIIADTREQKNKNVLAWLDSKKIKYKVKKLDCGDYSCYLPAGAIKGVDKDIYFDKEIVIEKKANIDEIAGNFSAGDMPRIKSEFAHLKAYNTKVYIFVSDQLFDKHLRNGSYRSQYSPQKLYARLKGFEAEYNTVIRPVNDEFIGSEIYNTLYYHVRHILMRKFDVDFLESIAE